MAGRYILKILAFAPCCMTAVTCTVSKNNYLQIGIDHAYRVI